MLLIPIAYPFNGGMRVASVDCPISEVRSLTAMRAPRETLRRSMKDTCPTPIMKQTRARSGTRLRDRFWRETLNRNRACRDRLEPFLLRRDHRLPRLRGMLRVLNFFTGAFAVALVFFTQRSVADWAVS